MSPNVRQYYTNVGSLVFKMCSHTMDCLARRFTQILHFLVGNLEAEI